MQLVTALGLHRRRLSKINRGGSAYVEQELRKRIFWSAYTLDKYLSVMFGRPRLLDYEDIDQDMPDEVNDEDMFLEAPPKFHGAADCMMTASVLHFRLRASYSPILVSLLTVGLDLGISQERFLEEYIQRNRHPQ